MFREQSFDTVSSQRKGDLREFGQPGSLLVLVVHVRYVPRVSCSLLFGNFGSSRSHARVHGDGEVISRPQHSLMETRTKVHAPTHYFIVGAQKKRKDEPRELTVSRALCEERLAFLPSRRLSAADVNDIMGF